MKKHYLLSYLFLFVFACTSPDEDIIERTNDISMETIGHLLQINSELIELKKENLPDELRVNFAAEIQEISTEQDLLDLLTTVSTNPDKFLNLLKEEYRIIQSDVKNDYFSALSEMEIHEELSNSIYQFRSSNSENEYSAVDCGAQFKTDLSRCHDVALVESAACGLLSPTLLGALACGAFVIIHNELCHDWAYEDYKTCKNQEK